MVSPFYSKRIVFFSPVTLHPFPFISGDINVSFEDSETNRLHVIEILFQGHGDIILRGEIEDASIKYQLPQADSEISNRFRRRSPIEYSRHRI